MTKSAGPGWGADSKALHSWVTRVARFEGSYNVSPRTGRSTSYGVRSSRMGKTTGPGLSHRAERHGDAHGAVLLWPRPCVDSMTDQREGGAVVSMRATGR